MRGAQAKYLAEVDTAAQHIPSQIDIVDGRLKSADSRLNELDRRAETLTAELQIVTTLRDPLTRIYLSKRRIGSRLARQSYGLSESSRSLPYIPDTSPPNHEYRLLNY